VFSGEPTNTNVIVFGLTRAGSKPRLKLEVTDRRNKVLTTFIRRCEKQSTYM